MQQNGKAFIGRERDSGRKIIDGTWIPGNVREQFTVRELSTVWRFLRRERTRKQEQEQERESG